MRIPTPKALVEFFQVPVDDEDRADRCTAITTASNGAVVRCSFEQGHDFGHATGYGKGVIAWQSPG